MGFRKLEVFVTFKKSSRDRKVLWKPLTQSQKDQSEFTWPCTSQTTITRSKVVLRPATELLANPEK